MAKSEKDQADSYEPDAFDNPPKGPAGMHRGVRSAAARFAPFVVVVLVSALCGVGAWGVFSGEIGKVRMPWAQGSSSSATASSSAAAKKKAAAAKKKAAEEAAAKKAEEEKKAAEEAAAADQQAQTEQQQAQQAVQPDKTKGVTVINGTGVSGYAATKQSVLASAGYTNVVASNPTGTLPSATVVWYESDADKATADDVASTLGIANVQQASGLGGSIVVVLMS